jgi:type IV pilus assembly protein PilP
MTGPAIPIGGPGVRPAQPAALCAAGLLAALLMLPAPARAAADLVLTATGELLDPTVAHAAEPPAQPVHPPVPAGHPNVAPTRLPVEHAPPIPAAMARAEGADAAGMDAMADAAAPEREMAAGEAMAEGGDDPAKPRYIYSARELRDPFMLPAALRAPEKAKGDLPPLQRYAISDFRLVAVVRGGRGTYAMVTTGDEKGYTVRVGTRIGPDGRVRRITKDAVIVEEVHPDEFGELRKSETVLALRPEEVVP